MPYSLFISSKSAISARRTYIPIHPKSLAQPSPVTPHPRSPSTPSIRSNHRECGGTKKRKERVYNTHRNLEDLLHARASRLDNGLDVLAAETGLLGDGPLNQDAVLGEGDLTGEEDLAVDLDGLRLLIKVSVWFIVIAVCGGIGGWWGRRGRYGGGGVWISLT